MSTIKEKFVETLQKYNVANDNLIPYLGEELFTSPASTSYDLHNAFEGGLVRHLFKVASYAVKINAILPENMKQPMESIMRVSLLCEIGKVGQYTPTTEGWKKAKGIMYDFVKGNTAMRVGQRSIYYLSQTDNKLSEVEYQAILNHDVSDDSMITWHSSPLTRILRQAIEWAIVEEKLEHANG